MIESKYRSLVLWFGAYVGVGVLYLVNFLLTQRPIDSPPPVFAEWLNYPGFIFVWPFSTLILLDQYTEKNATRDLIGTLVSFSLTIGFVYFLCRTVLLNFTRRQTK